MDKRTLIFVFAMTVALLGINTFFSYWDQQRAQEWMIKEQAKKEKQKEEIIKRLDEKSVSFQSLPVVKFQDRYALKYGSQILLIKERQNLPEKIELDGAEYTLDFETGLPETPAVYVGESQGNIAFKTLPNYGSYDLQLIFLSEGKTFLGEYRNSYITLPIERLAADFPEEYADQLPSGTAIALLKVDRQYIPVGTYNTKDKLFTPLSDYQYLDEVLTRVDTKEAYDSTNGTEKYYVLENAYQQLVFSNRGGAITEINLPFESDENPKSVVREIGFDRDMVENNPQNARFPSKPYVTINEAGEKVEHDNGALGGYYPLLRRDLIQKPPRQSKDIPADYYAFNVVSEYPEVGQLIYQVTTFEANKIVFEAKQPHRKIRKTYEIDQGTQDAPYVIDLLIEIEGDSRGLWLTSGIPDVEWINGAIAPALKVRVTKSGSSQVDSLSLPDPKIVNSTELDWLTNSNGFFGVVMDPLSPIEPGFRSEKISGVIVPSRLTLIDQQNDRFNPEKIPGYMNLLPLNRKGGAMKFRIVAGPFATPILTRIDQNFSDPETGYNPDYIANQSFHGWFAFISQPFSKFLFLLMNLFHSMTGSWGISIILLTVALRIMIYPLTAWGFKSQKKMQEISPRLKEVQERYKNDPKKLQVEMSKVYKESGVNPVGGCLTFLIQIPFLIGMFDLLKSTFELRGAPFVPGWIDNLAAPDVLFSWQTAIPFIGNEFHLLPVLVGLSMLAQTQITARSKDPSEMSEQERQMLGVGNIMAFFFAFMFYNAPSGLCLYWICSTFLGLGQQRVNQMQVKKAQIQKSSVELQAEPVKPIQKGRKRKR